MENNKEKNTQYEMYCEVLHAYEINWHNFLQEHGSKYR